MSAGMHGAVIRALIFCAACLLAAVPSSHASSRGVSIEIFGTAPPEVFTGEHYLFSADATVLLELPVRFSVENAPPWALFDPVWGRLIGTPKDGDTGTYDNILISATNGLERVTLPAFSIRVRSAQAPGFLSLSWEPPLTNTDGSELTNLAGYRVYAGRTPADLQLLISFNNIGLTRYPLQSLEPGTHYFAMSAINEDGVESALSPLVSGVVP